MKPMILAMTGPALIVALAGCSSSGSNSNPSEPRLTVNGLAYAQGAGPVAPVAARLAETAQGVIVTVDGEQYTMPGASLFQHGAGVREDVYFPIIDGEVVAISHYNTRNALALVVENELARTDAFLYGGLETPAANLPVQRASYEGILRTGVQGGGHTIRNFVADADFESGAMAFDFFVRTGAGTSAAKNGEGHAVIDGSGFSGTAQLDAFSSVVAQQGTLSGGFFGANGEDIAGHFSGTAADGSDRPVGGVLIGTQQP